MPKRLFVVYGISLVVFLFSLLYVAVYTRGLSGALITHYDPLRGIDYLGDRFDFYRILFGTFLISLFNFGISMLLYIRIRFFAYFVAGFTLFLNVLALVGIMYLIGLNV
ncbi:MAG: hypothetical protein HZA35_00265 [Parcubacteria group bacterium]|nr:hypothetical protein [Parcubacteria group bacterium]